MIILLIFGGGYLLFLALVGRHYWRRFKKEAREPKAFNYQITDIWAATLALTPSLYLSSKLAERFGKETQILPDTAIFSVLLVALISGQLMGIFIGRVVAQLEGTANSALTSGLTTFFVGLLGMTFPLIYYIGLMLFFVCIALLISKPVLFYVVAVVVPILYVYRKYSQ